MNVTVPDRRSTIQVELTTEEVLSGPDTLRYNYRVNNILETVQNVRIITRHQRMVDPQVVEVDQSLGTLINKHISYSFLETETVSAL